MYRGEMASATESGSDINLTAALGRLQSIMYLLKALGVTETYKQSCMVYV